MNNLYGFDLGNKPLSPMEARVLPWVYAKGDDTLRLNYKRTPHSLVYDVGGYKGEWATPLFKKYQCQIKVFEPVKRFIDGLEAMFKDNTSITIYPFGLGGNDRTEKIGVDWEASSIFKPGDNLEKIKIRDVAKVMGKDEVDLIKINIEGGEYELLNRLADTGQIKQIKNIQVQFHDFVPKAVKKRQDLRTRLRQTHHLTYCYPFVWENWERHA